MSTCNAGIVVAVVCSEHYDVAHSTTMQTLCEFLAENTERFNWLQVWLCVGYNILTLQCSTILESDRPFSRDCVLSSHCGCPAWQACVYCCRRPLVNIVADAMTPTHDSERWKDSWV